MGIVADATSRQLYDVAQARAKKLEPRVSKLMVNVPQQSQIEGLEVARGDPPSPQPIAPIAQGRAVVVGAGALALLGGGLGFELWAESRYDAAKAEMMSQPRRDSLYSAANTRRYVGEALAVGGLAAGGAAVWLYLRDGKRERPALGDVGVHVVPTVTGLALAGEL